MGTDLTRDHFRLIAGLYNKTARFIVRDSLLRLLDLPPDAVLLDAGGGTGRVAIALHDLVGCVVIVDLSMVMMKYAADKGLRCVNAPVEFLPFSSGSFDRVIMMDVLHHVQNQKSSADELYRALRPGGRLVIIEPDIHKFSIKLIALAEKLLLMRSKFLTGDMIAALFSGWSVKTGIEYEENNVLVVVEK